MMDEMDNKYMTAAYEEAKLSRKEGGIPIGAALFVAGKAIGLGRNRRLQRGSVIRHAEMDCLENAGRLPAGTYEKATLYTTLSPCQMCAGAIVLYKIPRVVIGENETFSGAEQFLRDHGVELVNLGMDECKGLMKKFIAENPAEWHEDIGEK